MKRSERFYQKSRRAALWGMAWISAMLAGCAWSVRAWQECAGLGFPCLLLALAGLCFSGGLLREAWRLARLGRNEERWEWERSIRPRL